MKKARLECGQCDFVACSAAKMEQHLLTHGIKLTPSAASTSPPASSSRAKHGRSKRKKPVKTEKLTDRPATNNTSHRKNSKAGLETEEVDVKKRAEGPHDGADDGIQQHETTAVKILQTEENAMESNATHDDDTVESENNVITGTNDTVHDSNKEAEDEVSKGAGLSITTTNDNDKPSDQSSSPKFNNTDSVGNSTKDVFVQLVIKRESDDKCATPVVKILSMHSKSGPQEQVTAEVTQTETDYSDTNSTLLTGKTSFLHDHEYIAPNHSGTSGNENCRHDLNSEERDRITEALGYEFMMNCVSIKQEQFDEMGSLSEDIAANVIEIAPQTHITDSSVDETYTSSGFFNLGQVGQNASNETESQKKQFFTITNQDGLKVIQTQTPPDDSDFGSYMSSSGCKNKVTPIFSNTPEQVSSEVKYPAVQALLQQQSKTDLTESKDTMLVKTSVLESILSGKGTAVKNTTLYSLPCLLTSEGKLRLVPRASPIITHFIIIAPATGSTSKPYLFLIPKDRLVTLSSIQMVTNNKQPKAILFNATHQQKKKKTPRKKKSPNQLEKARSRLSFLLKQSAAEDQTAIPKSKLYTSQAQQISKPQLDTSQPQQIKETTSPEKCKIFECQDPLCRFNTEDYNLYQTHVMNCWRDHGFMVCECGYKTKIPSEFKLHCSKSHSNVHFSCVHCAYLASSNGLLSRHVTMYHTDIYAPESPFRKIVNMIPAPSADIIQNVGIKRKPSTSRSPVSKTLNLEKDKPLSQQVPEVVPKLFPRKNSVLIRIKEGTLKPLPPSNKLALHQLKYLKASANLLQQMVEPRIKKLTQTFQVNCLLKLQEYKKTSLSKTVGLLPVIKQEKTDDAYEHREKEENSRPTWYMEKQEESNQTRTKTNKETEIEVKVKDERHAEFFYGSLDDNYHFEAYKQSLEAYPNREKMKDTNDNELPVTPEMKRIKREMKQDKTYKTTVPLKQGVLPEKRQSQRPRKPKGCICDSCTGHQYLRIRKEKKVRLTKKEYQWLSDIKLNNTALVVLVDILPWLSMVGVQNFQRKTGTARKSTAKKTKLLVSDFIDPNGPRGLQLDHYTSAGTHAQTEIS